MILFTNAVKGISALQVGRDLGVSHKTAYVLLHKIRESLLVGREESALQGEIHEMCIRDSFRAMRYGGRQVQTRSVIAGGSRHHLVPSGRKLGAAIPVAVVRLAAIRKRSERGVGGFSVVTASVPAVDGSAQTCLS